MTLKASSTLPASANQGGSAFLHMPAFIAISDWPTVCINVHYRCYILIYTLSFKILLYSDISSSRRSSRPSCRLSQNLEIFLPRYQLREIDINLESVILQGQISILFDQRVQLWPLQRRIACRPGLYTMVLQLCRHGTCLQGIAASMDAVVCSTVLNHAA